MTSEPQELELTPDLLEYAKAVAMKLAPDHCKPRLARPMAGNRGTPYGFLLRRVVAGVS